MRYWKNPTLCTLQGSARAALLALPCLATACSTFQQATEEPSASVIEGPVSELSCDESGTLKSVDSVGRITLQFQNDGVEPLSLHWINYNGEEEPYGKIAAGAAAPVRTYFTHPWVLRDRAGECVAVYVSGDTADIRFGSTDG